MRREILQTIAIALLLTGQAATALECDGFVVSREEPDLIAGRRRLSRLLAPRATWYSQLPTTP